MIREAFGLTDIPFAKELKTEDLFPSNELKNLKKKLELLLAVKGIGLVSGEPGSGKSTSVRAWTDALNHNSHKIIYLSSATDTLRGFLRNLSRSLGCKPAYHKDNIVVDIYHTLDKTYQDDKKLPIITIDEAQNLSPPILEEIRLIINSTFDIKRKIVILLVSSREFAQTLKLAYLKPLRQRISRHYMIAGLSKDEIKPYIEHHLKLAGSTQPIFSDDAIAQIFNYSRGLPRMINTIAIDTLEMAANLNTQIVEDSLVQQAIEERENL